MDFQTLIRNVTEMKTVAKTLDESGVDLNFNTTFNEIIVLNHSFSPVLFMNFRV